MGCSSSQTEQAQKRAELRSRTREAFKVAQAKADPADSDSSLFRVDRNKALKLSREWVFNFNLKHSGEKVKAEEVVSDTVKLLQRWPRGQGAGELLLTPSPNRQPIEKRGVKLSWLQAAWNYMVSSTEKHLISTRMFVELMVRPLLVEGGPESDHLCLLDFVPLAFRAEPNIYVCHTWDGYFRHLLVFPENVKKNWPADSSCWLDFFSIPQADEGPNADLLSDVKKTIQTIGRTVVVFPGDGTPDFAILPVKRSWCVYEIVTSERDAIDFRVGLHGDLDDVEFHTAVVQLIEDLDVAQCKASYESDETKLIDEMRETRKDTELNSKLKAICRQAFAKRYEAVPMTPKITQRVERADSRLSNGSNRGRINSLSDLYSINLREVQVSAEAQAPEASQSSNPNPNPNF